jgi:proteasome lid subunit RPN8/RPN11
MTNADHSPLTYRLDPLEHLRTFDEIDERGWELAGIFHSHTHTEAYPSPTDRRLAFYPEATYVLVSLRDRAEPEIRAFRIVDGEVTEREVVIR